MAEKKERPIKVVAENRKARFNYAIEDSVEAGIVLTGTEVKSVRNGKTTIAESYADTKDGEIWLVNANIPASTNRSGCAESARQGTPFRLRSQLRSFVAQDSGA